MEIEKGPRGWTIVKPNLTGDITLRNKRDGYKVGDLITHIDDTPIAEQSDKQVRDALYNRCPKLNETSMFWTWTAPIHGRCKEPKCRHNHPKVPHCKCGVEFKDRAKLTVKRNTVRERVMDIFINAD